MFRLYFLKHKNISDMGAHGFDYNLLAEKMALAGGGEFTTPWMNDNTGGLLLAGNPIPGPFGPRLYFDGAGLAVLPKTPTTDVTSRRNTIPRSALLIFECFIIESQERCCLVSI